MASNPPPAPVQRLAASATRVKNKQAAAKQITAEQLVREAVDLQEEEFRAPKQLIASEEELAEFRLRKRKEFEDYVRLSRWKISEWVKYANFEERQKDYERARSVWERTLEVDHRNVSIWLKYAEMEMRAKFINHARNVWDRAVSLLPRVDQLWYKYIHMEEMLGNVAGARQIYERWMKWEPDHQGWRSYIKMELRYGEEERARGIYERYIMCHPSVDAWVHYARFEKKAGNTAKARAVYERAVEIFAEDADEELFMMFAQFEELCKEFERARCIYKYALDSMPTEKTGRLYMAYVQFEKQHGEKDGIEVRNMSTTASMILSVCVCVCEDACAPAFPKHLVKPCMIHVARAASDIVLSNQSEKRVRESSRPEDEDERRSVYVCRQSVYAIGYFHDASAKYIVCKTKSERGTHS